MALGFFYVKLTKELTARPVAFTKVIFKHFFTAGTHVQPMPPKQLTL